MGTATATALAQIARATFGHVDILFYLVQAFTAGVLILAANTAFNGFPMLASILARDRYAPRQLYNRGDRLVYSNGVVLLALAAIGLIVLFNAELTRLIQLYIIGVFVSFTLSQAGMVKHWRKELRTPEGQQNRRHIHRSLAINSVGATMTAIVLVIVLITKFTHGAWLVIIAMPLLFFGMKGVRRHYDQVARRSPSRRTPSHASPPATTRSCWSPPCRRPPSRRSASPRRCDPTRSPH